MNKEYLNFHHDSVSFNEKFFNECLKSYGNPQGLMVVSATMQRSLADDITIQEIHHTNHSRHPLGVKKYELKVIKEGQLQSLPVLVKSKETANAYVNALTKILKQCGLQLPANKIASALGKLPYTIKSDIRPIEIYKLQKECHALLKYMPELYGYYVVPEEEIYIMVTSFVQNAEFATTPSDHHLWDEAMIELLINECSEIQAIWQLLLDDIAKQPWCSSPTANSMAAQKEYWESLADYSKRYMSDFIRDEDLIDHYQIIDTIPDWWQEIEQMPQTLIYNDLTLKNVALTLEHGKKNILLFDWDLATIHLPQRDIGEFLSYVLPINFDEQQFIDYIFLHREQLIKHGGVATSSERWLQGYLYALYDYLIDRLSLYLVGEDFEPRNVSKLYRNTRRMIDICRKNLETY